MGLPSLIVYFFSPTVTLFKTDIQSPSFCIVSNSVCSHTIPWEYQSPSWRTNIFDSTPLLFLAASCSSSRLSRTSTPRYVRTKSSRVRRVAPAMWNCLPGFFFFCRGFDSKTTKKIWLDPLSGWSLSSNALKHAQLRMTVWRATHLATLLSKPTRWLGPSMWQVPVDVARIKPPLLHRIWTCWCQKVAILIRPTTQTLWNFHAFLWQSRSYPLMLISQMLEPNKFVVLTQYLYKYESRGIWTLQTYLTVRVCNQHKPIILPLLLFFYIDRR